LSKVDMLEPVVVVVPLEDDAGPRVVLLLCTHAP
jgi:hypothetical protein